MSAVPQPASLPLSSTDISCPECGQENPAEEAYCTACGAALQSEPLPPPLTPLSPGTLLADTYTIETVEPLGRENRYLAVDATSPGGSVLLRERAGEEAEPFQTLIARTAELKHPAFLIPDRVMSQDDRVYLVCPRVPGIKLSERIDCTSEREAVSWGVQLCQALGVLHRRELLCVDLPPEGVLLDKEGRVRITQLNASVAKGEVLDPPRVTDGYSAPEAYKPGLFAATADVFAVGALLYTLLVGKRLPIEGWLVQYEPPVFYPEKVLSPNLERVLRTALALDPKERYESLDALKAALLTCNQKSLVRSAWLTDVGQIREHNEDAVLVKEDGQGTVAGNAFTGLYIVSDGMGGAEAGEVASALAIETVARHIERARVETPPQDEAAWEQCLREAVEAANATILTYAKDHPSAAGLGATIVVVLLQNQRATLAWVGDSRIYLWEQGQLQQLSRDHSLVARLVEIGQLTADEARTHEHRNVLIRSLGSKEQITVDTISRPLRRGARLLLCSDGLTSHVEDGAIADILSRHREPVAATSELIVAANAGGGSDNISAVVVFHE
ncbi:MAG: Stp1/IreP family PP2C-type Ser/Thr phosphatase [Deltaproteobacteria bacterium]|nr:Stp1/IreP family PP2C-type Ser/Thr phosphatase [Deltaproteobacteria bacterium]